MMIKYNNFLIGMGISIVLIILYIFLLVSGRSVSDKIQVQSDMLNPQEFQNGLNIISKKEKNGDLPVNTNDELLQRSDPFEGL
ncbi:MAG: hypothetical protein CEN89_211 [Candidatus Berkelbacteria bacterium Licking1014_7]|uniref:Uncharacterized protein n=1 Tax=Candidatus Berkelbacteria bacterium Licking1014_7 TaxID=2017147 RepID=A0A554LK11_9BACT|nr:MAG: hypothetical protein CEN89_211 [Candidatus Berkelbacteria bacterium Licking1014_7]